MNTNSSQNRNLDNISRNEDTKKIGRPSIGAPTQKRKIYDLRNTPKDTLVSFSLGGQEEVGINMVGYKYNDDIIFIDMGLEFPDEEMLGVDYIIPDITPLRGLEKNIKGIYITHGHYDHIGAIPHLIDKLGNPKIYGLKLTIGMIKKRQEEFRVRSKPNFIEVGIDDTLKLGVFKLNFIRASHNIPDSSMVIIESPVGKVIHTGDYKFDMTPVDFNETEIHKIAALHNQNVLALYADSTNADQPGHQISELVVEKSIRELFTKAEGRIIIGTFASLLSRIQQIIKVSEELGKKVVIDGRSMKNNVAIAHELGYIKYKRGTIIEYKDMGRYPDNKIVVACTGAQGEDRAVLMRIANNEHRQIRIQKGDTVVFSSSVIPGNERSVQKLRDSLYKHHANVINYTMMDIHAGGHAKQEDIKLLIKLINPKFYIPIYGTHTHLKLNAEVAEETGILKENIFTPFNGQLLEFNKNKEAKIAGETLHLNNILVDGLGIGDVSGIVLRDRKQMSEHGMIVIISSIKMSTGELVGNPDIISRGFIYMNANKKLVEDIRLKVKETLKDSDPLTPANQTYIKDKVREDITKFIYKRTHRNPMVLPVILLV